MAREALTLDDDRYLSLTELAQYAGLSVPSLKRLIADPVHPLPAHRPLGRVRVKRSDYDRWLVEHEETSRAVSGKGLTRARRAALELRGYQVED